MFLIARFALACALTAAVLLAATKTLAAEPIEVFAGIPPAAYLAERIGGDRVHAEILIRPGQDPHTFEPAPKQIQALAKSRLFFKVGMSFEDQLLEKIRGSHPRLIVVDTTEGIEKLRLSPEPADHIDNDNADHNSHGHRPDETDPHVWLSPLLLKIQAANIAAALEKLDPSHASFYQNNLSQLRKELDGLDADIRKALAPYAGQAFYVFHPAFGYFADCYQLKQEAIEAGGKQPSPKQLRALIEKAKAEHARVIFVQPQFDRHSAQTVADAIGGRILIINDLEKDVLVNLRDMAVKIEKAYDKK